jgi:hypothetical protein
MHDTHTHVHTVLPPPPGYDPAALAMGMMAGPPQQQQPGEQVQGEVRACVCEGLHVVSARMSVYEYVCVCVYVCVCMCVCV